MHIVFDHQIFATQAYGGISRYFVSLAEALAREDGPQAVTVLAPWHKNRHLADSEVVSRGRRLPAFPASGRVLRAVNGPLSRRWLARRRPDILHRTHYYEAAAHHGTAAGIVTVHDMIHELFPRETLEAGRMARLKRAAVNAARRVICVSRQTRDDLVRLTGIDPGKTRVVHHGPPAWSAAEPGACPAPQRPVLLFVGERGGYKNFAALLQALAGEPALAHCEVRCFGGGPFTREERGAVRRLGLDAARFTQLAGDDRVLRSAYAGATALVLPSRYEGFGLPVLEAMAAGCPVACSDVGALREVAGPAALYFPPDDPPAMAAALRSLVDDPRRQAELRERGDARVADFSWARCAGETLAVYREALAER